ncbi:putative Ufm1-specific protease 1 [Pseudolycoriella hygida]|uniref:Ufm1-specific protease 1 n=1 Tax=Pseudolycoriella hygida TaxID=35572 RepID=A0A9Q0MRV6_9DIPT|nr:putative Ufm1-specific protease 1 [Pseudolycoriella hygida]
MSVNLIDSTKYKYNLLNNVGNLVDPPRPDGKSYLTRGDYTYFHYSCDNVNDVGWGCGYRTCQSLCSWIAAQQNRQIAVPTLLDIQKILVDIGDKPKSFNGSRQWIGALEVFYIIDTLFDISCKIQHIPKGEMKRYINILRLYFEQFGGLVMMGGDVDASSKGIAGIHIADNDAYLLVIDPHFVGEASIEQLVSEGFVKWRHTSEFSDSSFYNLCLPQLTAS